MSSHFGPCRNLSYHHGVQRTRGRTTRSASDTPSYSITTQVYCPPLRHYKAHFQYFRYPTRSLRRACPRRGFAARSLCASTRSSVATLLCAGNYSRRWSHCYVKTSLLVFRFGGVSQRRGVRLYSLHPSPSPNSCPISFFACARFAYQILPHSPMSLGPLLAFAISGCLMAHACLAHVRSSPVGKRLRTIR